MRANQDKCHFPSSLDISTKISPLTCFLDNSGSQKLLGATIDRKLNLNVHVTKLWHKASRKIEALGRIFSCISEHTKTSINECLFYVSNLLLSFSLRKRKNSKLLEKAKSVAIHHFKLERLVYEIFKVKNNMVPEILTETFPRKESNNNLRNSTALQGRSIKTAMYGSKLYLVWDQKYGTFYVRKQKILCLLHYSKRKLMNGPQRIVHVIYLKRTYETLISVRSLRTSLFGNMWYVTHMQL